MFLPRKDRAMPLLLPRFHRSKPFRLNSELAMKTPLTSPRSFRPTLCILKVLLQPSSLRFLINLPGEVSHLTIRPDTPLPPSPPPPPPLHPLRNLVSYALIFPNAHPAWEREHQLWTHTNADKLIKDWDGEKKNFGRPIPVFKAVQFRRDQVGFEGWW